VACTVGPVVQVVLSRIRPCTHLIAAAFEKHEIRYASIDAYRYAAFTATIWIEDFALLIAHVCVTFVVCKRIAVFAGHELIDQRRFTATVRAQYVDIV
jgi:hypothetical protein